jgi:hypothetical protein
VKTLNFDSGVSSGRAGSSMSSGAFFPKAADLLLVKVMVTIENQLLTVTSLTRKDISPE